MTHPTALLPLALVLGFSFTLHDRLGVSALIVALLAGCFGAAAINLSGVEYANFWSALFALGVGWNFLFVGGTTLLTEAYTPAEKAKVQGINDLLVFGVVAATASNDRHVAALTACGPAWRCASR